MPNKHKNHLHLILSLEVFQRWKINFVGPIELPISLIRNQYIIIATNYTIKWIEARSLKDNTAKLTTKVLYEEIIICFGCPIELISD